MRTKILLFFMMIGLFFQSVISQQVTEPTTDVLIEVKNETLEITVAPQNLSLELTKSSLEYPQSFSLSFENSESIFTLVNAELNEEKLWLLQSSSSANNEKVLTWNFDKDESKLTLYPYNWSSPYVLKLDVQVNLKKTHNLKKDNNEKINLIMELNDRLLEATPNGRGNQFTFK